MSITFGLPDGRRQNSGKARVRRSIFHERYSKWYRPVETACPQDHIFQLRYEQLGYYVTTTCSIYCCLLFHSAHQTVYFILNNYSVTPNGEIVTIKEALEVKMSVAPGNDLVRKTGIHFLIFNLPNSELSPLCMVCW